MSGASPVRAAASGGPVSWSFLGFSVAPRRLVPPVSSSSGALVGPLSPPRVAPSVGRRRPKAAERAPICPPSAPRTPPELPPSCPPSAPRHSAKGLGRTVPLRAPPPRSRSGGKSDRTVAPPSQQCPTVGPTVSRKIQPNCMHKKAKNNPTPTSHPPTSHLVPIRKICTFALGGEGLRPRN